MRGDVRRLPWPDDVWPSGDRKQTQMILVLVCVGVAAAGLGYGASRLLDRAAVQLIPPDVLSASDGFLLMGLALVVLWAVIAIHEAGHVVGGFLVGFQFESVVAGFLRLDRTDGAFRLGFNRQLALMGGLAVTVPTDPTNLRKRMRRMVLAGPLASLVAGGGLFALVFVPDWATDMSGPVMATALAGSGALMSVLVGIVTLLPSTLGGFPSDGARVLQLSRSTPESRRDVALLSLSIQSRLGVRPRDWSPSLLSDALLPEDASLFGMAASGLAYATAIDSGNTKEAQRYLEHMLRQSKHVPEAARKAAALEAAWFAAAYCEDLALANAWLKIGQGDGITEAGQLERALAAVYWLSEEPDRAQEQEKAARSAAARAVDQGTAAAMDDWLALGRRALGGSG